MNRRRLYFILAALACAAALIATSPVAAERVRPLQLAGLVCSVPGVLLSEVLLPGDYMTFFCTGEPPPYQKEIVGSAIVVLNSLFWPALAAFIFGCMAGLRRCSASRSDLRPLHPQARGDERI